MAPMRHETSWRRYLWNDTAILIYLAVFKLLVHLLVNGQYGYFRDELAYLDDAKRLAWGYVDHPPLSPFIGSIALALFGPDSLIGLRFFPALAGACMVVLVGLITRELGGKRFAQVLAALVLLISPVYMLSGVLFQSLPFEQILWGIAVYLLVRLIKTDNPKLWPLIGIVLALEVMTKYTTVFFVAGLAAALLLTPYRKYLVSPWLWLGVLLASVMMLPNFVWQVQHDFISLTYTGTINARDAEIGRTSGFLLEQFLLITHPFTIPIWLSGLYFVLVKDKRLRVLGLIYLVVGVLFLILHGRSYYLSPAYPMLFAAGACMVEQWLSHRASAPRLKPALMTILVIGGLIFVPAALPVLPINSSMWKTVTGINDSFVEMIGWEDQVAAVADIYAKLPEQERASTAIFAGNYGEAGAVNLFGLRYGLPQAICPTNSYYYWSQDRLNANTYIMLGVRAQDEGYLRTLCEEVTHISSVTNRYQVQNEETGYEIYVCRRFKTPLTQLWPRMQRFG